MRGFRHLFCGVAPAVFVQILRLAFSDAESQVWQPQTRRRLGMVLSIENSRGLPPNLFGHPQDSPDGHRDCVLKLPPSAHQWWL